MSVTRPYRLASYHTTRACLGL